MDIVFEVSLFTAVSVSIIRRRNNIPAQSIIHLRPTDLPQLSWLSNLSFGFFVWQATFRNSNIKCFADLNELQFSNLLYDTCSTVQLLPLSFNIHYNFCFPQACGPYVRCEAYLTLRLRLYRSCRAVK